VWRDHLFIHAGINRFGLSDGVCCQLGRRMPQRLPRLLLQLLQQHQLCGCGVRHLLLGRGVVECWVAADDGGTGCTRLVRANAVHASGWGHRLHCGPVGHCPW
jgi:hypothetical protein